MNVVIDTNIIVRTLVNPKSEGDAEQREIAINLFQKFDKVIIPTHVFCELAWLLKGYNFQKQQIYFAFQAILESDKFVCREEEIEAGMLMLEKDGDFADGVNEYSGRMIAEGNCLFASFDKQAVQLLNERGIPAMIPGL
ncbi:MAG: type II toxin-antitoxin system VapC family toxin [Zoogloeaceae bacterium]|jgi:predicted nucleic-acid-binding protein|nr:type II toxin-antitoxin system VapC family toxin [Zoogloeaceae bacterium]